MKFKSIIISFVSALITIFLVSGSYTIYAKTTKPNYYTFKNPSSILTIVKAQYHKSMNDYFNDKLSMLIDLIDKGDDFYKSVDFNSPKDATLSNYAVKCGEKNVSTYCVSMAAMDIYLAYVDTLNKMKGYLPMENLPKNPTADNLLGQKSTRDLDIDKEYGEAKITMEATVSAYDEFRMAYPVHKKYVTTLKGILKYRTALEKIRNQVLRFPGKFIDATSAECK
ncbi:MAG: hypothetical protein Q8P62_04875 [Candidatus Peregrinibacteria bacterium]|nr:hypothetical protein [Candidatus Peregrinibacteria bacterium]